METHEARRQLGLLVRITDRVMAEPIRLFLRAIGHVFFVVLSTLVGWALRLVFK